jgi:hypothetical protein
VLRRTSVVVDDHGDAEVSGGPTVPQHARRESAPTPPERSHGWLTSEPGRLSRLRPAPASGDQNIGRPEPLGTRSIGTSALGEVREIVQRAATSWMRSSLPVHVLHAVQHTRVIIVRSATLGELCVV